MSSDLQVPFQTRKPGARRYTNLIVRNHYILAPGRETVRETSKSCVSRSNRESWEACKRGEHSTLDFSDSLSIFPLFGLFVSPVNGGGVW